MEPTLNEYLKNLSYEQKKNAFNFLGKALDVQTNENVIKFLDMCDELKLTYITTETYKFGDVEYLLSCDDKDYVTFHKTPNPPYVCDRLMVCDYQTTEEPVWRDWYMTINYHS